MEPEHDTGSWSHDFAYTMLTSLAVEQCLARERVPLLSPWCFLLEIEDASMAGCTLRQASMISIGSRRCAMISSGHRRGCSDCLGSLNMVGGVGYWRGANNGGPATG
jgi:hypothetical protein